MLKERKVKLCKLIADEGNALFLPGKTLVKRTLADTPESYPGIQMRLTFAGVECKLYEHTFIVPFARFCNIVLEDEANADKA